MYFLLKACPLLRSVLIISKNKAGKQAEIKNRLYYLTIKNI
jgi:hypothetical protein